MIGIRKGEIVELYESESVEEVEERIGLRFEEDGGYWKEIEEGEKAELEVSIHKKIKECFKLPDCPGCLGRLDYVKALGRKKSWSECICCSILEKKENVQCFKCEERNQNWLCLICGFVGCGRYAKEHAKFHYQHSGHTLSIEFATRRIWNYSNDSYVHILPFPSSSTDLQEDTLRRDYEKILEVQLSLQRDFYEERFLYSQQLEERHDFGIEKAEAEVAILNAHLHSATQALNQAKSKHDQLVHDLASNNAAIHAANSNVVSLKSQSKQRVLQMKNDIRDLTFHHSSYDEQRQTPKEIRN